MAAANFKLSPQKLQGFLDAAQSRGVTVVEYSNLLTSEAFPESAGWSDEDWGAAFSKKRSQQQEEAYAFWSWATLPTNQQQKLVQTPEGQALSVLTFGADELPGSTRSLQQWSQKTEYCISQCKRELKTLNTLQREATRKLTFIERRLDIAGCSATDLARHVKDEPEKRCALWLDACKIQFQKGRLCFPLTCCIFCGQYCCSRSNKKDELLSESSEEEEEEGCVQHKPRQLVMG